MRERQRQTERDRQRQRETETDRERDRERQRKRDREREGKSIFLNSMMTVTALLDILNNEIIFFRTLNGKIICHSLSTGMKLRQKR